MANLFLITTFVILVGAHADPNNENDNPFRGFPFGQFPFPNIFAPVHFPQFRPIIPQFSPLNIPSPQDIINKNPKPGETFSGIVVHSSSGYSTDEKGNVVKTDGTTVLTNENGVLKEYKVGNNPPVIKNNIVPPVPDNRPLRFLFPHNQYISLNNDKLQNVKPAANQNFISSSSSSFSVSGNLNGKKNYAGASKTIINNNGQVDEQALIVENNMI